MYIYDKNVDEAAIFYVDVALIFLNCFGYLIGTYLLNFRRWNPKHILALGGSISLTGIFLSSFTTDLMAFVASYGMMSGIGCGMNYFVPLVCCWEWFPQKKGLITGIIVGSYGIGTFIFVQVATWIVNPDNEQTSIEISSILSYFDESIASRVPTMLRILCLIWGCQVLGAVILISRPKKEEEELTHEIINDSTATSG